MEIIWLWGMSGYVQHPNEYTGISPVEHACLFLDILQPRKHVISNTSVTSLTSWSSQRISSLNPPSIVINRWSVRAKYCVETKTKHKVFVRRAGIGARKWKSSTTGEGVCSFWRGKKGLKVGPANVSLTQDSH
jgi:hypothetical protein